ncbi:hypothetical protein QNI19_33150 [Cytophagaceae bacterium DM2B3-1]|uniref:Uncharacterized protein n=1 Tax=Xanthocytophaga flava TaxID=3048013 RepID=A0ABT7CVN2_9BACT|nr:hypothetical protein [Xanthocytophaga flavus]MDJ1497835.1 hypothetical protein [Xanthocytophaga flavus]
MASPIQQGTLSVSPFSSRDVRILKEKINLTIGPNFQTAEYHIEYIIEVKSDGKQIPLLFHAQDYANNFTVRIDGITTTLLPIPEKYKTLSQTPFEKFSSSFSNPYEYENTDRTIIYWEKKSGSIYTLKDLHYFEATLTKGIHTISVDYIATPWIDGSNWVNNYSFRYSLSPAKYWKSFGSLEITLDARSIHLPLTTNLGQPSKGSLKTIAIWNFASLPAEYWFITYTPTPSKFAQLLIAIEPGALTLILTLIVFFLHILAIRFYRKHHPEKRFSWVMITGSLFIPFFILIMYEYFCDLIDYVIGEHAAKNHGYRFVTLFLYPLILLVYWPNMWQIDKYLKQRIRKQT